MNKKHVCINIKTLDFSTNATYFEKMLDCCDNERVNDKEVTLYYKCLSKLLFHLSQLTTINYITQKPISEIKDGIAKDIDDIIESYRKI